MMINFKILCLICLCFVLTKVIGTEKYSNSTTDSSFRDDKATLNVKPIKNENSAITDKSNNLIKKNEKIKMNEERFKVLKSGSDIQLQKNSMQNSFQAVYGQAFIVNDGIIDNPIPKVTPAISKSKTNTPKPWPNQPIIPNISFKQPIKPVQPPSNKPPIVKDQSPFYHFNKKPIVYQCCRYVFPAELYFDHLLFYSKYGHTFSQTNTPKNNENLNLNSNLRPEQINQQSNQLSNQENKESELFEQTDQAKNPQNQRLGDKLVDKSQTDYSNQRSKLEQDESDGRSDEKLTENLNEKSNEKSNGKSDAKPNENKDEFKEPDEAATNLFKTWKSNNQHLYNFGSCVPIYEISGQMNIQNNHHQQPRSPRWPFFG